MEAATPIVPAIDTVPQPLTIGAVVRPKATRGAKEVGVVRQVAANGLVLVYFYASGHRRWFKPEALVATGERVAPKAGPR